MNTIIQHILKFKYTLVKFYKLFYKYIKVSPLHMNKFCSESIFLGPICLQVQHS